MNLSSNIKQDKSCVWNASLSVVWFIFGVVFVLFFEMNLSGKLKMGWQLCLKCAESRELVGQQMIGSQYFCYNTFGQSIFCYNTFGHNTFWYTTFDAILSATAFFATILCDTTLLLQYFLIHYIFFYNAFATILFLYITFGHSIFCYTAFVHNTSAEFWSQYFLAKNYYCRQSLLS